MSLGLSEAARTPGDHPSPCTTTRCWGSLVFMEFRHPAHPIHKGYPTICCMLCLLSTQRLSLFRAECGSSFELKLGAQYGREKMKLPLPPLPLLLPLLLYYDSYIVSSLPWSIMRNSCGRP